MANIEYFANEVKTEQDAVQDRTATSAKIQPRELRTGRPWNSSAFGKRR
jgi:hypothetical protein